MDLKKLRTKTDYEKFANEQDDYRNSKEYLDTKNVEKQNRYEKQREHLMSRILKHFNADAKHYSSKRRDIKVNIGFLEEDDLNDLIAKLEKKGYSCNLEKNRLAIS